MTEMEKPEVMDSTGGTTTPTSFQTSVGSVKEQAEAAERIYYLKGSRLSFLSLRLAQCEFSFTID